MFANLNVPLTGADIAYAAVAALCVTLIIRNFIRMHRIMKEAARNFTPAKNDVKMVLERCYAIFPIDKLNFHGQTFKRGMKIKITTIQDKIFEGELIGFNNRNMICIMTSKLIVAHELKNIREISLLEDQS